MTDCKNRLISNSLGTTVVEFDEGFVIKTGIRVRRAEFLAMEMVSKQTSVPIPEPILGAFRPKRGEIIMSLVPGDCLRDVWHDLDAEAKTSICTQIWDFVKDWSRIPKPANLQHLYQCSADGKTGKFPFLAKGDYSLEHKDSYILSDTALRERICENYYYSFDRKYTKAQLFDMLPRCDKSVFTHGELLPKNIMVSGSKVTGIIDWETAGWYPEYWEHIGFMTAEDDYVSFMRTCAPQNWDLSGIHAASRVLI